MADSEEKGTSGSGDSYRINSSKSKNGLGSRVGSALEVIFICSKCSKWIYMCKQHNYCRVIFMEDTIPIRPDRSVLLGRQSYKWTLWDVVFHENNFKLLANL